eukprot:5053618-Pyramimonas_sp.AAC.1
MPSTGHQWITTWVTVPPMEFPGVAGPQTDIPWSGWVYQRTSPGHRGQKESQERMVRTGPPLEWRARQWTFWRGEFSGVEIALVAPPC